MSENKAGTYEGKEYNHNIRERLDKNLSFWFLIPFVVFLLFLVIYPVIENLIISLEVPEGESIFQNYIDFLTADIMKRVSYNTAVWLLGSVGFQFLVGMGLALLLDHKIKGYVIFRTIIIILPWAIPDVVAGSVWRWMMNDMYGVFNDILVQVGIIDNYIPWLAFPTTARMGVIIANIWKGFALSAMFYLAALQTIPEEYYEVAKISGANAWQRLIYITLPSIKSVILTTLMLTTIWTINYFPLIWIMTEGGPSNHTDTFVTLAYKYAFRFLNFGDAAAVSNISFMIVFVIAVAYVSIIFSEEERN